MKRFVLHPREILSRHDNQWRFISAERLASLYGVPMTECHVDHPGRPLVGVRSDELIHLFPLYGGDYREHLARLPVPFSSPSTTDQEA